MKTIQKIAAALIVILGLVHIGFTFRDYDGLSMNAMWFAGAGFAIVFAGFLNVAMLRHGRRDRGNLGDVPRRERGFAAYVRCGRLCSSPAAGVYRRVSFYVYDDIYFF